MVVSWKICSKDEWINNIQKEYTRGNKSAFHQWNGKLLILMQTSLEPVDLWKILKMPCKWWAWLSLFIYHFLSQCQITPLIVVHGLKSQRLKLINMWASDNITDHFCNSNYKYSNSVNAYINSILVSNKICHAFFQVIVLSSFW